jgi:hypothetical protein
VCFRAEPFLSKIKIVSKNDIVKGAYHEA